MKKLTTFIFLLSSLTLLAVPARKDPRVLTQADGSLVTVYAHGDECFSWLTNAQGQWVEKDKYGMYRIVEAKSEQEIAQLRRQSPYYEAAPRRTPVKINIAPRGLVVLVQFQDVKFQTPRDTIDSMLNAENYTRNYSYTYDDNKVHIVSAGSARKYYQTSSYGQYNPCFDVIGPLTVSHNAAYYGSNSPSKDANAKLLFKEACEQVAAMNNINLSRYNNDGDNTVDFVYFIFAGYGEADGGGDETIWAHTSNLKSRYHYEISKNGVYFDRYACNPEMNNFSKQYMGIGTFCHEFGHVLGLPDIYSTSRYETTHKTSGYWDIMDYGCYLSEGDTPPSLTGYERFFFGWATPRVLNEPEDVTLNTLLTHNEVLLITSTSTSNLVGNDPNPANFYVLDNRQQKGMDLNLPGHGMLITKIDYSYNVWNGNNVNSSENDMHVDIIEADGVASYYGDGTRNWFGKLGDAFPSGATEYKAIDNQPITNIKEDNNGVITFQYKGGAVTTTNTPITEQPKAVKTFQNGQLYINRNGNRYTFTGQAL